jgi:hypothetical protein
VWLERGVRKCRKRPEDAGLSRAVIKSVDFIPSATGGFSALNDMISFHL